MSCYCVDVRANTQPLQNLLRHVAPQIPELPFDLAFDLLRQAYITFAQRSNLLACEIELPLQKGVKDYMLEAPDGYEVYGLLNNGPHAHSYVRFPNPHTWCYSWGRGLRLVGSDRLEFQDAPSREGLTHTVALHLLPTECVTTIPNEIAVPFGAGIAKMVVGEALEMPNKAWTNPNLAAVKKRDFYRAALTARNLHITNRGTIVPALKPIRVV